MEPFSISCTTCKARLKVREESAIGQILACPKCSSMVLVAPPDATATADEAAPSDARSPRVRDAAAAAGVAVSADAAFGQIDELLDEPAPPEPPVVETPAAAPQHPPAETPTPVGGTEPPVAAASTPATPPPAPPLEQDWVGPPLMPTSQWVSPTTHRFRAILMIVGAAAAGITLAVAVLGAISSWRGRSETPPSVAEQPVPETDDDTAQPDDAPPVDDPVEPSPADVPTPMEEPTAAVEEPVGPTEPEQTSPEEPVSPLEQPVESPPDEPPIDIALPQADPDPAPDPPSISTLLRPAPRQVDVVARLGDPIPGIQFDDVPLVTLLRLVGEMSAVPITIDPDALAQVGMTPRSPVSCNLSDTTVGALLNQVLGEEGLGYEVGQGQLLIVKRGPPDGSLRRLKYTVGDLAGEPAAAEELAALVARLVEPNSWTRAGGKGLIAVDGGALVVAQTEPNHFRTLVLCEKLRVARGLAPRSRYDAKLFELTSRSARADGRLATPITANFPQPTPLVEVLDFLSRVARVDILVDWRSLEQIGWTRDTETTLSAGGEPLGEALADMLAPMQLAWRAVDAQTLQVTTIDTLQTTPELELYRLGPLLSDAGSATRLIVRLEQSLGLQLLPGEVASAFHVDTPSRTLLVRLPQPTQRRVEQLLTEWQKELGGERSVTP